MKQGLPGVPTWQEYLIKVYIKKEEIEKAFFYLFIHILLIIIVCTGKFYYWY